MTGAPDDLPRLPPDRHPLGAFQEHHGRAWTRLVRPGLAMNWYVPCDAMPNSHLLLALLARRAQFQT